MKKIFLMFMTFLMMSLCVNAQEVTTFMGIPVDGTMNEMIPKLIKKGFKRATFESYYGYSKNYYREIFGIEKVNELKKNISNVFYGEFNGRDVQLSVVTNKNKIYRIRVEPTIPINESQIKIQYNNLLYQFKNSSKYISSNLNERISDEEDISYQMSVYNKEYQSAFYQAGDNNRLVWFMIFKEGSNYKLSIYYDNVYNQANGEDL